MSNPRVSNGAARRALAQRLRALGEPCCICGRPIDYSLPAGHPLSFEMDEDLPTSRWSEFGYRSAMACALDPSNVHAAHRICNERKGDRTLAELRNAAKASSPLAPFVADGWD